MGPFRARARRRAVVLGLCWGCGAGFLMLGAANLVGRLLAFSGMTAGLALAVGSLLTGVWLAKRGAPDDDTLAAQVDAHFGLMARVRTARELERMDPSSGMAQAQMADALRRLAACAPAVWMPRVVPRWAWGLPLVFGLAWTPLLLPVSPDSLSPAERGTIREASRRLSQTPLSDRVREAGQALRRARNAEEALAALADAQRALEGEPSFDAAQAAFDVQETLRTQTPADALAAQGQDLPPQLREELRALRERVASNPAAEALARALDGIEAREVSAEALARIVRELRRLEALADRDLLATLRAIREQKRAVALAAADAQRPGRFARLDQTPGRESDGSVALGLRLGDEHLPPADTNVLTLEGIVLPSARETRVYSTREGAPLGAAGDLLPYEDVVLSGQRAAAAAIAEDAVPARYRASIRAYFDALAASAGRETR
jgi:hypothetical protein